jgi:hypothetical protein
VFKDASILIEGWWVARVERSATPESAYPRVRPFPDCASLHPGYAKLDLDLGSELDHLLGRNAKEGGGAFGVALQEGKQRFPP